MSNKTIKTLTDKHQKLIHSEQQTVVSHVQREDDDCTYTQVPSKCQFQNF